MGQERIRTDEAIAINGQLQRARNSGLFGTPEAQAGRFEQQFAIEKQMAHRLVRESQSARLVWANWEAINDQLAASEAREAILEFNLGALTVIRGALARDAILKAFRISDGIGRERDRDTLSCFAEVLADPAKRQLLESEGWVRNLGYHPQMIETGQRRNMEIVVRLLALVPIDAKTRPNNPELFELRTKLKPLRDRLAHALSVDNLDPPIVDEIRRFIDLTLELTADAALLFLGSVDPAKSSQNLADEQAADFWKPVFSKFIQDHLERIRSLA